MTTTAKIFKNGASQAVRLPKEFRFDTDEVCIKRVGAAVVLFPKNSGWDFLTEVAGKADPDFMADRNQPRYAERRKPLETPRRKGTRR
jgi:antitoxin VapB